MKRSIEFTFNEIECLLLMWRGRELQQHGCFTDNARAKLQKARNEMMAEYAQRGIEKIEPEQAELYAR